MNLELDPQHQAVADQARLRVMELIGKGKLMIAELIVGEAEDSNG